jgi:AraC family transcriptional regulator
MDHLGLLAKRERPSNCDETGLAAFGDEAHFCQNLLTLSKVAMAPQPWLKVHAEIGQTPIVAGAIAGATPIYVERFLFQTDAVYSSGIDCPTLMTHFGGGSVQESHVGDQQLIVTQTILVPADIPTTWRYSGSIDYAIFYLLDDGGPALQALRTLAASRDEPRHFSDALVSAAARQIVNELQKGAAADEGFLSRLATVMLEQAFRALTMPARGGISPQHAHYSRLQAVLNHIHASLDQDLSLDVMAAKAGVSRAHFRRLFQDATGMAPHRYVLAARLEQARKLLGMSVLPLAQIAGACGFSSQSHLTASFRAAHAVTPAQYRANLMNGVVSANLVGR